jgi:hypothetical protein
LRQIQGEQTIRSAIARDAALRAGGAQTLQAQQLRDQALRAGGAQTLQAQQLRDQALKSGWSADTSSANSERYGAWSEQALKTYRRILRINVHTQRLWLEAIKQQCERWKLTGWSNSLIYSVLVPLMLWERIFALKINRFSINDSLISRDSVTIHTNSYSSTPTYCVETWPH